MKRFEENSDWDLNYIKDTEAQNIVSEHNTLVEMYNELLAERNKLLKALAPMFERWSDVNDIYDIIEKGE